MRNTNHSQILIIGAGLSGLSLAYFLKKEKDLDIRILESREDVGGRIETTDLVDFGATWFNESHSHLIELFHELGLEKFEQYSSGKSLLVYNSMAPAHEFESDPNAISIYRAAGGSKALITALKENCQSDIRTSTSVISLRKEEDFIKVETNRGEYRCEKLIFTLPPNLIPSLKFSPALDSDLLHQMIRTHTWMSNAIKVGLTFREPFWRKKGFSGTVIGQIGPVIELYDHCSATDEQYALMGFVNEGLRPESREKRKEKILAYLEKYLGSEIKDFISYQEKDWSKDEHTSLSKPLSTYMSPDYGHPIFNQWYWEGSLRFSGTETAPQFGGYMEGAILSSKMLSSEILN